MVSAWLLVAGFACILTPTRVVHTLVSWLQLLALNLSHCCLVLELGESRYERGALVDGQYDDGCRIALRLWSSSWEGRRCGSLRSRGSSSYGDRCHGGVRVAAFRAALMVSEIKLVKTGLSGLLGDRGTR